MVLQEAGCCKTGIHRPKQMTRNQKILFFTLMVLSIGLSVWEIAGEYRSSGKVPWLNVTNTLLALGFLPFFYLADRRIRVKHEH
jgi:hypothetical protein